MKIDGILLTITVQKDSSRQSETKHIVTTQRRLDKTINKLKRKFYRKHTDETFEPHGNYTENSRIFVQGKDRALEITAEPIKVAIDKSHEDGIYRKVWYRHVIEDVKSRLEETGRTLTKGQTELAAEYYVYDGEYDCNQSYWEQIDGVIDMAKEK